MQSIRWSDMKVEMHVSFNIPMDKLQNKMYLLPSIYLLLCTLTVLYNFTYIAVFQNVLKSIKTEVKRYIFLEMSIDYYILYKLL